MLRVVLGPAPLGSCQHYTTGILPQLILDLCARMIYHHCHLIPCCNFTLLLNQWRQRLPPAVPSIGAGDHLCFLLLGCEGATGPFGFIPVMCVLDIPASVLEGQLFVVGLVTCQAARLRRNIENTVVCFKKKKSYTVLPVMLKSLQIWAVRCSQLPRAGFQACCRPYRASEQISAIGSVTVE